MAIALSGCSGSRSDIKVVNDFCSLTPDLPTNIDGDIAKISNDYFIWTATIATTKKCQCDKTESQIKKCWQEYNNLKKK